MTQGYVSGASAYIKYGYEGTYGTASSETNYKNFGYGATISVNRRNNMERIYGLGSRNPAATVATKYEGTLTVEFVLGNGWFWRSVIGRLSDLGSGPFTHTYNEGATTTDVDLDSITIQNCIEMGTNDYAFNYVGCKLSRATLSAAVGETVKVTLEYNYMKEATVAIGSAATDTVWDAPMAFQTGSLQLPTGTTIAAVQSFKLDITNTLEAIYGLGSRFRVAEVPTKRAYEFDLTAAFLNPPSGSSGLNYYFFGGTTPTDPSTPAAQATLLLTFSNGLGTTLLRKHVITLANAYIDENTLPQKPDEVIKENVRGFCLSGTSVVVTDNTSTAPV